MPLAKYLATGQPLFIDRGIFMGWQIIKQPDGKYCIFSSVVDNVTYYNCSKEQIVGVFIKTEVERVRKEVLGIIDSLDDGYKPYHQFTKTFDQMIATIEDIHGKEEVEKVMKMIKEIT